MHNFVYGGGSYVGRHGASAIYFDTELPRQSLESTTGGCFEGYDDLDHPPIEIVDRNHLATCDIADSTIPGEPYEYRIDRTVSVLARAHHDSVSDIPIA